ncbi:MAG: exopolysaccharide Pel transporter PelG [Spirochaetales bacterium]|nr:exopolysaccharide Pel transporter PelG [Spirochaetales bacterium]
MAGIGFRLKKLLDRDSYTSTILAHIYSAFISSGPWIISVLVIVVMEIIQYRQISLYEVYVFQATVVYCYAFSLIVIGLFQMPLTRYLADMLYQKKYDEYLPTYAGAVVVIGVLQAVIGITFCFFIKGWSHFYSLQTYMLFMAISFNWIALMFLGLAKNYLFITASFICGGIVSFTAGYFLGRFHGLEGNLMGYTMGQVLIFLMLTFLLIKEFAPVKKINFKFFTYMGKFPLLLLCGLFYNLGIWIDKFIIWSGPEGAPLGHLLYFAQVYDVPVFMAYLTMIPAIAYFVLEVETSFLVKYNTYYHAIIHKHNLETIGVLKDDIMFNLKTGMWSLVKVQGFVAILAYLAAPIIGDLAGLSTTQVNIMQVAIFAVFFHILFQTISIIMLYFEFRKEAAFVNLLFLLANAAGAFMSLHLGLWSYGYGYLAATILSFFVALGVFNLKIKNLNYYTFMQQSIA